MSEEAAFIAAMVAQPTDRLVALVFADWLDERNDLRGPMIRIDEVRASMAPTYENPLPKLIKALVTGKGVTQARKMLGLIGEVAVPEVVPLLSHTVPIVRQRAVQALALFGSRAKAAVPELADLVKRSDRADGTARREAVRLLGVLRAKEEVNVEVAHGLDSPDSAERLAAVNSMLQTKSAAMAIVRALGDSSGDVRRAAAQRLCYLAGPTTAFAVGPLRQALADTFRGVRNWSVSALGRIGPKAAAAVPDLLRLLDDGDDNRIGLVQALGRIGVGNPEVTRVLVGAARDANTVQVAHESLNSWTTFPPAAASALIDLARRPGCGNQHWDGQLVDTALKALGRITPPPPEVLAELRARLATTHAAAAARALAHLGPMATDALPELVEAFKQCRASAAYDLAAAIGKMGREGVIALAEALNGDLTDETGITLPAAAMGLKGVGPAAAAALPQLLALLRQTRRRDLTTNSGLASEVVAAITPAVIIAAIAAIGPAAADAIPELVDLFLAEGCPDHQAHCLHDALTAFGPTVLPFTPRLSAALARTPHTANHERILRLFTELIPHGFDAIEVFRDALRMAIAASGAREYHPRVTARAAVAGLAAVGPTAVAAIPELMEAWRVFDDIELQAAVLTACGGIGGPTLPHIRLALAHTARDVRLAAVEALARTGDTSEETWQALRKAETDSTRIVRSRATAALKSMSKRKRR